MYWKGVLLLILWIAAAAGILNFGILLVVRSRREEKTAWTKVWLTLCTLVFIGVLLLVLLTPMKRMFG